MLTLCVNQLLTSITVTASVAVFALRENVRKVNCLCLFYYCKKFKNMIISIYSTVILQLKICIQ